MLIHMQLNFQYRFQLYVFILQSGRKNMTKIYIKLLVIVDTHDYIDYSFLLINMLRYLL
jgi:hypothetical protein